MKRKKRKSKNLADLRTFFLACEFKPSGANSLWSTFEPFAYDIKPAFIYGTLGMIGYNPDSYAILDVYDEGSPLLEEFF